MKKKLLISSLFLLSLGKLANAQSENALFFDNTDVEARFRNSTGVNYDVVASGITLNTWQHLAMTYDGTTLTLYLNGVVAGSTPAPGSITNSFEDFLMGNLLYQATSF